MARKTHNDRLDIPPLELECMKMLWTLGSATVHEVRGALLSTRPLAYTTVMTLMDRLARKGHAQREKRGRTFVYRPVLAEEVARDFALDRLTRNFFRGSREALRQHLAGDGSRPASALPGAARGSIGRPLPSPDLPPLTPMTSPAPKPTRPARRAPQGPAADQDALDPSLL